MTSAAIRPLTSRNWEAWWALRLAALRDHPDAFSSAWEEAVAAGEIPARQRFTSSIQEPNRILGAFTADGTLVGTCGIRRASGRKTRHRMDIWGMYVVPEWRGTGTGTRLLESAIGHARQVEDVLQIHLVVASHNIAAIVTYSRLGFVRYGREPRALRLPDRFVDEDFMVLMLDTPPAE